MGRDPFRETFYVYVLGVLKFSYLKSWVSRSPVLVSQGTQVRPPPSTTRPSQPGPYTWTGDELLSGTGLRLRLRRWVCRVKILRLVMSVNVSATVYFQVVLL